MSGKIGRIFGGITETMDLRSIVNAEDTPDARKLPAPSPQSPLKENSQPTPVPYQPRGVNGALYENRTSNGPDHHEDRPSYPPPIRTVSYNDPYPQSGSPGASVKQGSYPVMRRKDPNRPSRSQLFYEKKLRQISVANIDQAGSYPYPERGSASSSQGHHSFSTPLSHTPTGSSPGSVGAYSAFQRPTSSHSATPGSAHYPPSSLTQRSPQSSNAHARLPSQPQSSQQYSSQPHTPLGPPSGRPSYNSSHESPGTYGHERTYSSGSYGQQHHVDPPVNINRSPLAHSSRPPPSERLLSADSRAREQSLSVSPKTRIDTLPVALPTDVTRQYFQASNEQIAPVKRTMNASLDKSDITEQRMKPLTRRSTSSFAIGGLLNEAPANDRTMKSEVGQTPQLSSSDRDSSQKSTTPTHLQKHQPSIPRQTSTSPNSDHQNIDSVPAGVRNSGTPSELNPPAVAMEGVLSDSQSPPTSMDVQPTPSRHFVADYPTQDAAWSTAASLKSQPARKKPRLEDKPVALDSPPVIEGQKIQMGGEQSKAAPPPQGKLKRSRQVPRFAQSVRNVNLAASGNSGLASVGVLPGIQPAASGGTSTASPVAQASMQPTIHLDTNGNMQTNGTYVPMAQPEREIGPLGPWEPSILDMEPIEDITKVISDWLFSEVVQKQEIGVGPAGGSAGKGAVLEIEAKLGRLIDQNTNDRLRLPVISECVISQSDPNMRINFESSMTEAQHRAMNDFLNKAVQASLRNQKLGSGAATPSKKRLPISYKHTYETDRFYELSQQGLLALPLAITDYVEARHKRKTTVRITNDQKTGKEIAKIVKARLADINVYNPRTWFDYRISVNVEMNFEGSMADLVEPDSARGRKPDRNKDRMSYTHLAYRIDLTQVTPPEGFNKADKEHELEIELSSEEVRRQGLLAMNKQDNGYDKLVKGFLDNVRVLARQCQQ